MSATAKAPPPKRKPPTPKVLRPLTLSEAAEQWITAKEAIEAQKALIEQAAPILERHFNSTGRRTYRDRIAYERTGGSLVLDQPKVRAFLGKRLQEFQKRTERGWTLKLLK